MKTIMLGAAIAASLATLSLAAAPAIAQEREEISINLSAKGFDLTRPAEVARFRDSVDRQIRRACASQRTGTRLGTADTDQCRKEMTASANQQIDREIRLAAERASQAEGG